MPVPVHDVRHVPIPDHDHLRRFAREPSHERVAAPPRFLGRMPKEPDAERVLERVGDGARGIELRVVPYDGSERRGGVQGCVS